MTQTPGTAAEDRRLPVVVLAPGNYVAPLAVMRSLRPVGARVYAPATRGMSLWKLSRYCAGLLQIGENGSPSRSNPEATVAELIAAGHALGGDAVLIPCSDEWALFVARHADRLSGTYRFPRLGHELAQRLGDKHGLHTLATEHGVASPATVRPTDCIDAARLSVTLDYPVVIKTAVSRGSGNQLAFARNAEELVSVFDRMDDDSNLICQQLVAGQDGGAWLFNGYFDDKSHCMARFTGRKLRQWPAGRGITVLAEAARNLELEEIAVRFLTAIGYRGAVDLDFLQDAVDGRYYLLDFNPRLGGVFRAFQDERGLDLARAMYLDLTGATFDQEGQRDGRRLVVEGGFTVATLKSWRERTGGPRTAIREVARAEPATFRMSDPLPFAVQMAGYIKIHTAARVQRMWPTRTASRPERRQETPAA